MAEAGRRSPGGLPSARPRVPPEAAQEAASGERLRALLDLAADGIVTIDERGKVLTVNPAVERMFGYSVEELVGGNVSRLMPEPDHGRHDGYLATYLETGEARIIGIGREVDGRRKDGSVFPLELAVTETPTPGGRVFLGVLRDVSRQRRVEALQSLLVEAGSALSGTLDPETALARLATLAVAHVADYALAYLGSSGEAVRRVAAVHADDGKRALLNAMTRHGPAPDSPAHVACRVIRSGETLFIPHIDDAALVAASSDGRYLDALRELAPTSAVVAPLSARGRVVGAVSVVTTQGGKAPLGEEDLAVVEELVRRAALAVDNALLFQEAEASAERLARLHAATADLAHAGRVSEVAGIAVEQGLASVGARTGALGLRRPGEEALDVLGVVGLPDGPTEGRRCVPLDDTTPLGEAVRTGETVYVGSAEELRERYPALEGLRLAVGSGGVVAVPLPGSDRILGSLAFGFEPGRRLGPEERDLLTALAQVVAQAIERATLYEAEMELRALAEAARAEADREREKAAWLARVSDLLNQNLKIDDTLQALVESVTGTLADYCSVHLGVEAGAGSRVAWAHVDPSRRELVEALQRYHEPADNPSSVVRRVVRSGEPVLVQNVDRALLREELAGPPEALELVRRLDPTGALVVPLAIRGQVIGVLALVRTGGGGYADADVPLAMEVARRAAAAVDNARHYAEAERANQAKAQFLGVMSHELRTPLTGILGYADLLDSGISGPLTEGQRDQVRRIKMGVWHLATVIEEILTYARTEVGREVVRRARADIVRLVSDSVDILRPRATHKGIELEADLPEGSVWLDTDEGKVRQILINLLGNAVKFTDQGGVRVELDADASDVEIRISDTGPGIPPEHVDSVFEPFTQVDPSETREKSGTGLGLAVSRRLARLLGGDVTLRTTFGGGSTFMVRLPRDPTEDQDPDR